MKDESREEAKAYISEAMSQSGRYTDNGVKVGHALASALLTMSGHEHQRPLSAAKVNEYSGLMKRGEWHLGGTAIKIDVNGRLINGRTRLEAVTMSDEVIDFDLTWNCPPDEFKTEDIGKGRTPGDFVAISGIKGAHGTIAAVTRLAHNYGNARNSWVKWRDQRPTPNEIMGMALVYTEDELSASIALTRLLRAGDSGVKVPLNTTAVAAFLLLQSRAWPTPEGIEKLCAFVTALQTGNGVYEPGNPVKALRVFAQNGETNARKKGDVPVVVVHLHLLFRHFGAWMSGESLARAGTPKAKDFIPSGPYKPKG